MATRSTSKLPIGIGVAVVILLLCLCLVVGGGLAGFLYFRSNSTVTTDPAVIYVLDTSPRMNLEFENGTRLQAAQAVLAEVVRPADPTVKAGLRIFGSGTATGCTDTELLVPLAAASQPQIVDTVFNLTSGESADSALTEAMLAAIKDLSTAQGPHTLVVITGGTDSCNAEAGALIKQEVERAGIELQEFVIGLAVTAEESAAIKVLIEDTVGTYLDAPDLATLRNILLAIQNYIDQPSATTLSAIPAAATPGAVVVVALPTGAVADSTPSASTEAYQSQTACDQPYWPLRAGATWTFNSNTGPWIQTVESVSGDLNEATAIFVESLPDGSVVSHTYRCSAEGIVQTDYNVTGSGFSSTTTISDATGVFFPNPSVLLPGATWTHNFTTTNSNSPGSQVMTSTYTAGEAQTLTTPAGSFDVIQVVSNTAVNANGQSVSVALTIDYGYGVGIVKSVNTVLGNTSTLELISYTFP